MVFDNPRNKGILFVILNTILWSGNYVVGRIIIGEIPPITFNSLRWLVTLVILCCFALPTLKREWQQVKKFLPVIAVCGVISVSLYNPLAYIGAQTTSAANLALISVTTPIFIVLFSYFKGDKPTRNQALGCVLAFAGSVYLVIGGDPANLLSLRFATGDILMLIAAIIFAVYSMLLSKVPDGISQTSILLVMTFIGLVLTIPFVMWEWAQPGVEPIKLNRLFFITVIYTGVGNSLLAWWLWNLALVNAGPVLTGVIHYTLPIMSGIFGYLILGEQMTAVHYVSGAAIIGGGMWCLVPDRRRAAAATPVGAEQAGR